MIELHDKFLAYVSTCFCNSSLFHKSLKEAFEAFCNKNVAGSTSAELMANFCDNLLKKVWLQPHDETELPADAPGQLSSLVIRVVQGYACLCANEGT